MDYDTECQKCGKVWEQSHPMKEGHQPCPACKSKDVRSIIAPQHAPRVNGFLDRDWPMLNGGRGQYFSQMETSKTCTRSPENCFRSRADAIEACKRRGFDLLDK